MKILLSSGRVKRYLPWFPRHISILVVLVFLFASIISIGAGVFFWPAAAEAQGSEKAILHRHHLLVQEAIGVQHRHLNWLMRIPDVVGTGVGIGPDGLPVIKVFTKVHGVKGIPEWLESTPVHVEVTGMVVALQTDPTLRYRPAPIGVSTGHPAITAGTIGARVKDAAGNVYALSNNHVYANQNEASIGESALQPGAYDGGKDPTDKIGTLFAFEPIDFTFSGENYIDAAIVKILDPVDNYLGNSTPPDDMNRIVGYGTPNSAIFGDSNGDGLFDNTNDLLHQPVQKYGRTTGMTRGQVDAINVFVEVCYEQWWIFCTKSAYFYDQIQISPAGFSGGGDSGSLIVTDDANKNPVGLLFAGSDTTTFANRIDRVLKTLGVKIDSTPISNNPPIADANGPYPGTEDIAVTFDGAGSSDPDGDPLTYSWDFGDGSTGTGVNPTHVYTAGGTYQVKLTVNDGKVNSTPSITKATIEEVNDPPIADAGPDQSVSVGDTVTLDGSGSNDPDGQITSYEWNFGDGSQGNGKIATHVYSAVGTYTVILNVTDNGGAKATDTALITVKEAPVEIEVFFDSFEIGEWNGKWIEDSQNDWFRSTQRAIDGRYSAEVDGYASNARLISIPIDLKGKTNATISFSWFIESGLDSGEYLAFDVSTNGGASWTEKARLRGNVDPENKWHNVKIELNNINSLRIRFRARMSGSEEDANVDMVKIIAR